MVVKSNRWMDFCMNDILVHSPSAIQPNTITSMFIGYIVKIPITLNL